MSLRGIGEFGGAIEADELGLRLDLQGFEDWVVVDLANLAKGFMAVNELALADRAAKLTVSTVTTSTWNHISLEALFLVHTCLGRWSAAEEIWNSLGKERGALDGERNVAYVQSFLRPLGRLAEDDLAPPKDVQPSRRWVARGLRAALGEWRLSRGEDGLAIEPLQDAVHMAREVGLTDPTSEALLALARYRLGDLPDAAAEADRLSSVRHPDHIALAQLWMAVGNPERAIQHATEAYRWAWADGEPYVRRYELTQAEGLLRELGAAMPVLPPYDPAKHPIELWEREVEAFIERIRNRPDDEPIDE